MIAVLAFKPVAFIVAAIAAIALLIIIIIDAHRDKKNRHRGRWK